MRQFHHCQEQLKFFDHVEKRSHRSRFGAQWRSACSPCTVRTLATPVWPRLFSPAACTITLCHSIGLVCFLRRGCAHLVDVIDDVLDGPRRVAQRVSVPVTRGCGAVRAAQEQRVPADQSSCPLVNGSTTKFRLFLSKRLQISIWDFQQEENAHVNANAIFVCVCVLVCVFALAENPKLVRCRPKNPVRYDARVDFLVLI